MGDGCGANVQARGAVGYDNDGAKVCVSSSTTTSNVATAVSSKDINAGYDAGDA